MSVELDSQGAALLKLLVSLLPDVDPGDAIKALASSPLISDARQYLCSDFSLRGA
jgi:hypothetical protein